MAEEQTKEAKFTVAPNRYFFRFKGLTGIRRKCRQDSGNAGLGSNYAAAITIRERFVPVGYLLVTVTVKRPYMLEL